MELLFAALLFFGNAEEIITVARMPPMTSEIVELINDLGNNSFLIRENASLALKEKGYEALRALEYNQHKSDPEIAYRVNLLLEDYYCLKFPKEIPGILRISLEGATLKYGGKKYVVPGAIRKQLYMFFWHEVHLDSPDVWYEIDVAQRAMSALLQKMLRSGVPKTVIEEWLIELAAVDTDWQPSDFGWYEDS
jgi:hypothetical protein